MRKTHFSWRQLSPVGQIVVCLLFLRGLLVPTRIVKHVHTHTHTHRHTVLYERQASDLRGCEVRDRSDHLCQRQACVNRPTTRVLRQTLFLTSPLVAKTRAKRSNLLRSGHCVQNQFPGVGWWNYYSYFVTLYIFDVWYIDHDLYKVCHVTECKACYLSLFFPCMTVWSQ